MSELGKIIFECGNLKVDEEGNIEIKNVEIKENEK